MIERERWQEVEAILDQVLDLPPGERPARLAALELEPEIRAEVDELLAAERAAGSFLEVPAAAHLSSPAADESALPALAAGELVGPYRISREIGRGGMGEVYEAWDTRLERRVALKRVRLEPGDDGAARRLRFRREARLAAGIDHPSVMRIHDLLEQDEELWLVMEYLEGETLARVLETGALGEARALALAGEITAGLAAAHARGVIHRDLKPQNVLVTPQGHAKVLDFGLAKRVGGVAETTLTAQPQILGTLGSMSPEQARGEDLDERSDLFSLGTLLYEMTTGERPFEGPTAAATLTRVCTHRPDPPRQRNPRLSASTSSLVERLLEKSPADRPRSAEEVLAVLENPGGGAAPGRARWRLPPLGRGRSGLVAGGLVVVAGLAWAGWWLRSVPGQPGPPRYVAVAEPEVADARPPETAGWVVTGTYAAAQDALSRLTGVAVVTAAGLDHAPGSPVALARELGAQEVLTSRLDCPGGSCRLTLSRLAAADGRLLWLSVLEVPVDDAALLRTAVVSRLREGYSGFEPRPGAVSPVSDEAYETYLRLLDAFRDQHEPAAALLPQIAELERREPGFLEAWLLDAEVARSAFYTSRDEPFLDRALEALRRARALAPGDPRVPVYLFDVVSESQRWGQAADALAALEELDPASAATLQRKAELLAHRGESDRALELMRAAVEVRPAADTRFNLALMEFQLGQVASARRTLETLLDAFPEHRRGRSFLAQLELLAGSPVRAVDLLEKIVQDGGDATESANLGTAYMLAGRYADAATRCRQAFEQEPGNAILALGLADALELSGDHGGAGELYSRVLDLSSEDQELPPWQRQTVRAQALAHLGRAQEAVAAAQQAWDVAPDNPQVALETALVYALTGDLNVALTRVETARRLGLGPAWFRLPWFAPLSGLPGYDRLVPAAPAPSSSSPPAARARSAWAAGSATGPPRRSAVG